MAKGNFLTTEDHITIILFDGATHDLHILMKRVGSNYAGSCAPPLCGSCDWP